MNEVNSTISGKESDVFRQDSSLQGELPELLQQVSAEVHATACWTTGDESAWVHWAAEHIQREVCGTAIMMTLP